LFDYPSPFIESLQGVVVVYVPRIANLTKGYFVFDGAKNLRCHHLIPSTSCRINGKPVFIVIEALVWGLPHCRLKWIKLDVKDVF